MIDFVLSKNQEKWLSALESGKYHQARGTLRENLVSDQRFCCLGVACEISGLGRWEDHGMYIANGRKNWGLLADDKRGVLGWLGMIYESQDFLTEYNDRTDYDFTKIASLIREDPQKYFVSEDNAGK